MVATERPEGCSVVILNQLWESVRGDADPALVRQLACQFELAQAIHNSLKARMAMVPGRVTGHRQDIET
jgi:hypothetical protein